MPDTPNQREREPQQGSIFREDADVPVEADEPIQPEHPRRAASAEFIVEHETGSVGVLREAMDPANQSLTDALRLSYRVLQIVIVILLVLFLVSGFRRIETSETGVQTLFGNIQGVEEGDAELQPGLATSWLPYPAAEFIVFRQNYALELNDAFWPNALLKRHATYEDGAKTIDPHIAIMPGLGDEFDGMVLLVDGIGHMQMQALFQVEDAVDFVERLHNERHAEHVVRLALQRAAIQVTSEMTLDEMIEQSDVIASRIQMASQEMLDDLDVGIEIDRVQMTNLRPPVAIYNSMNQLGEARSEAEAMQSEARSERTKMLAAAAGESAQELLDLISRYEAALIEQGPDAAETQSLLRQVDDLVTSERMGGAVAETIARAEAYSDGIQSVFASYAERFESLYPQYRANPDFVVKTQLYDAYGRIMSGDLVEIVMAPGDIGNMSIQGASSYEVMLKRREASRERRRAEAMEAAGLTPFRHQLGQHNIKQRLGLDEEGNVVGRQQLQN